MPGPGLAQGAQRDTVVSKYTHVSCLRLGGGLKGTERLRGDGPRGSGLGKDWRRELWRGGRDGAWGGTGI